VAQGTHSSGATLRHLDHVTTARSYWQSSALAT
jgi:hypothetical protein